MKTDQLCKYIGNSSQEPEEAEKNLIGRLEQIIVNNKINFSDPKSFNDPFEFSFKLKRNPPEDKARSGFFKKCLGSTEKRFFTMEKRL